MAYPFADDHDMIRQAARSFLQDWYDGGKGPERIYKSGKAYDEGAWKSFASELGMAGIAIDEDYGGAGLGNLGRVVVMEELGASLCSIPFLPSCAIAVDVLAAMNRAAPNARAQALLESIANANIIATFCDSADFLSIRDGHISGQIDNVLDGANADVFLITLKDGDNLAIYDVARDASGVSVVDQQTMDPTRGYAKLTLKNISLNDMQLIGHISPKNFKILMAQTHIALAAECVGGAQACLDMTLDYISQRVQFGRTIASFQAIKHRCADMFVLIEAARSAVYGAAMAELQDKAEASLIAKAYASDAFFKVAGDAIQLHGGIGFTWDYPLHYFFKRARANRAMFGSSTNDYAKLADDLLGAAA